MKEVIEELPNDLDIVIFVANAFDGVELEGQYLSEDQIFVVTESGLRFRSENVYEWELKEFE